MVHIQKVILFSHKKGINYWHSRQHDGARGYYAEWNKSETIPEVFTLTRGSWKINTKQNKTYKYREQIGSSKGVRQLRGTNFHL